MRAAPIHPSGHGSINRYPSLSSVSKAEIPRAIVAQAIDVNEFDDQTIETYISTPMNNNQYESSDFDSSFGEPMRRRGSNATLPRLTSQGSFSNASSSSRDLLKSKGSKKNLLKHGSGIDLVQDVAPDKKWSVKRDCFLERESPYNSALDIAMNEHSCREFLNEQSWPAGVQNMLIKNVKKIPLRIFICDDSGSMVTSDGKRLHGDGNMTKALTCTRWAELTESLKFHLNLSQDGLLPSEFRLLNGAAPVLVGLEPKSVARAKQESSAEHGVSNLDRLYTAFEESPSGQTPLCWHIQDVIKNLQPIADRLRLSSQKVAIIIATDGEPTDGDLVETLKPLQQLPVWLVVRLCTDDERIVNFWNNVDTQLELDMDVIDDLFRESEGVAAVNNWLTYSEPLHRLREFGITVKEFDLLDESLLTGDQIRSVTSMILDKNLQDVPHPDVNPKAFVDSVNTAVRLMPQVWDPVTKKMQTWLKINEIKTLYKQNSSCIIL